MSPVSSKAWTIRPAGPGDERILAKLGPETFQEAFGDAFPRSFIQERMALAYAPDRLALDLADLRQAWFLAESGAEAVGFLSLAEGTPPGCVVEPGPLELSRLYVRGAWQGRGPAFALMEAGLGEARRRRAGSLWLQAWERNPRALAFYRAHGFREAGRVIVRFGGEELPHLVLVRRLPGGAGVDAAEGPA
ncbi:MAG: GNAT family N-acetyltransferase [Acidobacteria bacterium]|nr:GNAT family N-acetyltransferase [Acidobacteriota bacterium]